MIIPDDGNVFVISDWSAIEARVNPWLSDRAEEKLDLFRDRVDVYKVNAARTFGVTIDEVDDGQRQIGKVQELSLGYGGGVGALGNMARAYGISLSEDEKQPLVDAWRRANHWAVSYWRDLERAVRSALASPAFEFAVGRMTYRYDESRDALIATLPSWREMYYPFPRIDRDGQITYAKAAWLPGADPNAPWPRASLWGGVLAENNAQAAANCLLREALYACKVENLAVVLHSHDEIVVETLAEKADETRSRLHEIMLACPSWAKGLPLAAETHTKVRYGK
jgi:DNA polymerase